MKVVNFRRRESVNRSKAIEKDRSGNISKKLFSLHYTLSPWILTPYIYARNEMRTGSKITSNIRSVWRNPIPDHESIPSPQIASVHPYFPAEFFVVFVYSRPRIFVV